MTEGRSRRSRSAVSRKGPAPLTPEQTAAWGRTYGRHCETSLAARKDP